MKQALTTMLSMQDRMNTRVHPQWAEQNFAWYRAAWIECGELIDHYGYKWWKKQVPDMDQVKLEIVDIWHFGMSALFTPGISIEVLADTMLEEIDSWESSELDVLAATERLALHTLETQGFSVPHFWDLMTSAEMDFDDLFKAYVGKNVLNFFRQDHGYKEGSYVKIWSGREDNEHLTEILNSLDSQNTDFGEAVYKELSRRYPADKSDG
ncbi:MAG: dimeric dUTPase (all-alpha-NTP-PPase superfamily) [Halieaceae bacterium]|jgi:dimeric dUTPase (all-alpha-NTP-PPase superfamily)